MSIFSWPCRSGTSVRSLSTAFDEIDALLFAFLTFGSPRLG